MFSKENLFTSTLVPVIDILTFFYFLEPHECFVLRYNGNLIDALNEFDGGVRQVLGPKGTAAIWATYPQPFLSTGNGFGDQVNTKDETAV